MDLAQSAQLGVTWIGTANMAQSMEWALVLASQGIDCSILCRPDEQGHGLLVSGSEAPAAFKALRQYQIENRSKQMPTPNRGRDRVFARAAFGWPVLMAVAFLGQSLVPEAKESGIMDRQAVASGEWWRLFTAMFLHGDFAHALANAVFGFLFLGLAAARFRLVVLLGIGLAGGLAGNLLNTLVRPGAFLSLGASGIVMAWLGVLAGSALRQYLQQAFPLRFALRALLGGVLLFVLFGLAPGTDISAHLAGFAVGTFSGFLLPEAGREESHLTV